VDLGDLMVAEAEHLRRISSVCSPSSGERNTSVGESDSLIGFADRNVLASGRVVDLDHGAGRAQRLVFAISFIDRIGPQGCRPC